MTKRLCIPTFETRLIIILLLVTASCYAQMGGIRAGYGNTVGGSLGGMMGGTLSAMMGGGAGLTVGADGTLYITRSVQSQGQSNHTVTQLAAIDANGKAKWTLPIDSDSASQPALGKDGTLFVTTNDWSDWMYSKTLPAAGSTPTLLVIKPGTTSATVIATIHLTGQMASAPQIAADSAGNYVVYVISVDAFTATGMNNTSTSGTYLNAFSPTGTLKYRIQLSQGGSGMMGHGMIGF